MPNTVETIAPRARRVKAASESLRSVTSSDRAHWLSEAAEYARRAVEEDAPLLETLVAETGLSAPMVRWAVDTTLRTLHVQALSELSREAEESIRGAKPLEMLSVVLAGNVFTAAVRALFVPLLLGVPVLAKPSSGQTRFVELLVDALRRASPNLGRAADIVRFAGGDLDSEASFVAASNAVSVYGTDKTVEAMASRLPAGLKLIRHGHGVSAAYCGDAALAPAALPVTAARLALDVAAYDQRGCLSPQVVYVANGARGGELAHRLSLALDAVEQSLPRGPLPPSTAAAQTQWRGLSEIEGTLYRGDTHAVAVLPSASPLRWSPGYRNVSVVSGCGIGEALDSMRGFAPHLKCVGTDEGSSDDLTQRLRALSWEAYVTPLGTMQTPTLDAPADGRPVTDGLLLASPGC